jgi:hypothetical protein
MPRAPASIDHSKENMKKILAIAAFIAALVPAFALAQGGPPLVTDDPGTPEDGHWEINLASIYARSHDRRDLALPDADINYGLGGHIQLKLDVPWAWSRDGDEPWKSGLGATQVGVKWRFLDEEQSGVDMSTYPQFTWNPRSSSANRGITSRDKEFFLPVEVSKEIGGVGLDAELGRNFIQNQPDEWELGGIVAPRCTERIECLLEVHETWGSGVHQTLVNLGARLKLGERTTLLGAVGREFGTSSDDQRHLLVYLGIQLLL